MKRIIDYFRGICHLTLHGCEPDSCMDRLLSESIPFWDIRKKDEFTLCLTVYAADITAVRRLALCCQCTVEQIQYSGFRKDFRGLKNRWALMAGLLAALIGSILLSNVIVALDVEGCEGAEKQEILQALDEAGVRFGTWGPGVDTELVQNKLLLRLPRLRWAAVNISGLRATVLITPQPDSPPIVQRQGASNLIADADGVITNVSVLSGQAACKPGDAVLKGDVLISGVVDLERCTMVTRALGEVFAETRRQIHVVTPAQRLLRMPEKREGRCIWLSVGRKRIKICGSSGIFMGDCVKIVRRGILHLPGGYPIPIGLWIETYYRTAPQPIRLTEERAGQLLSSFCSRWTQENLIAAQSLSEDTEYSEDGALCCLTQTLHCREMISRSAEIPILELEQHGTNDQRGTNGTTD